MELKGSSGKEWIVATGSLGIAKKWLPSSLLRKYCGLPYIRNSIACISTQWVSRYPYYLRLLFLKQNRRWLHITNNLMGPSERPGHPISPAFQIFWKSYSENKNVIQTVDLTSAVAIDRTERIVSETIAFGKIPSRPENSSHSKMLSRPEFSPHPFIPSPFKIANLPIMVRRTGIGINRNLPASADRFLPSLSPSAKGDIVCLKNPASLSRRLPIIISQANGGGSAKISVGGGIASLQAIRMAGATVPVSIAASTAAGSHEMASFPLFAGMKRTDGIWLDLGPQKSKNRLLFAGANIIAVSKETLPVRANASVVKAQRLTENLQMKVLTVNHGSLLPGEGSFRRNLPDNDAPKNGMAKAKPEAPIGEGKQKSMPPLAGRYFSARSFLSGVLDSNASKFILPTIMRSIAIPATEALTVKRRKPSFAGNDQFFDDAVLQPIEISRIRASHHAPSAIEHANPFRAKATNETAEKERTTKSPAPAKPPVLNMGLIADQVFFLLEKKMKLERERRGLYA